MDATKTFSMREIVGIGLLSGITVSLVKLIQWNFRLEEMNWVQLAAAGITMISYMALGAIGAVFLVDHDARGQKMLKNAFLMGFVAPSFFLALLNNPAVIRPSVQGIDRLPKISEFFIKSVHAQDDKQQWSAKGAWILDKSEVQPSLGTAVKNAFGWGVVPASYTYVVGTTEDFNKATAAADNINNMLKSAKDLRAFVVHPKGVHNFYVTIGKLGTPEKVNIVADRVKEIGYYELPAARSEEHKKAAALLLGGRIVDAKILFSLDDSK